MRERKKRTRIQVDNEFWYVPHGFGKEYLSRVRNPIKPDVWCDMLMLVGYEYQESDFEKLTHRQRIEAEVYAATEHLRASDNPIQRHPRPKWMGKPTGKSLKNYMALMKPAEHIWEKQEG